MYANNECGGVISIHKYAHKFRVCLKYEQSSLLKEEKMFKTYRITPTVFNLFLFGLTLIPAPIVIAQQADDVVVKCRPVTKTEEREVCKEQPMKQTQEREVCREQPKTEWDEQRQKKITKMETVCTKEPKIVIMMETVCTKEPRDVTYQECAK